MSRTVTKPCRDALLAHYSFTADVVDIAARIKAQAGARVRDDLVTLVACRLVWHGAASLFRGGYDGFPGP